MDAVIGVVAAFGAEVDVHDEDRFALKAEFANERLAAALEDFVVDTQDSWAVHQLGPFVGGLDGGGHPCVASAAVDKLHPAGMEEEGVADVGPGAASGSSSPNSVTSMGMV